MKLKYDKLLLNIAFNFKLRHYALELYEYYTGSENVGRLSAMETPVIRNVVMRNVNIDGIQRHAGVIAGLPEAPIQVG